MMLEVFVYLETNRYGAKGFNLPVPVSQMKQALGVPENEEMIYRITEWDCPFKLSEHESLDRLNAIIDTINEYADLSERDCVKTIIDNFGLTVDEFVEKLPEFVVVPAKDEEELGHYLVDNGVYEVPDNLAPYILYADIGRDWSVNVSSVFYKDRFIYLK
ncbi:antirestriction protein ArdA [Enterococcus cecorum]|uniref:antirestriction protein ArdA n=1 Tax=Enterococcus cecorum TaxID=44008 RepID=UPI001FADD463|nr:antirestriction protein ArdA [Enterococcus cecorum]MCJ0537378.1 antirestriction protein ArdA [Enterococcus cecorum]MCJ0545761.1 antirestriction protein ArdA [Enterococcus cecorum]MCJ0551776.1 antirestriction protein ArdA [Enterococcus cecorum]MCJ0569884.1 antirestriction protein ArdA [Enterococcus cecorum]